jgi:hypothetical protein
MLLQLRCTSGPRAPEVVTATAGVEVSPEEVAFTDRADAGVGPLRIPEAPEPWQKRPPCKRGEHAVRGACYQRFPLEDMAPPCELGIFEWNRQCWRAIKESPPSPVSAPAR